MVQAQLHQPFMCGGGELSVMSRELVLAPPGLTTSFACTVITEGADVTHTCSWLHGGEARLASYSSRGSLHSGGAVTGSERVGICGRRMQRLVMLLLLLLLLLQHNSACKNLRCFADYIETLTCMWHAGPSSPRVNLAATWDCGSGGTCNFLSTSRNASHTRYTCFAEQRLCIFGKTFAVKITTLVEGVLTILPGCKPFQFHENIKPQPPFNVTTVASPGGYNISWDSGYAAYDYLHGELQYQLRYGQKGRGWQGNKRVLQDMRNLWLSPQELEGGVEYELQVRSRPRDQSNYRGIWSDWSSRSSLRTLARGTRGATWPVSSLLALGLIAALVALLCWHQGLWKKMDNFIPNPAPFFQTLYLVHNGDFKKWVGTSRSGATLDIYECGTVLPEVYSPKPFLTRAAMGESSTPHGTGCLPPFPENRKSVPESAYGQLSIDTVTVADVCPECSSSLQTQAYRHMPVASSHQESLLPFCEMPEGASWVSASSGPWWKDACPAHLQGEALPYCRGGLSHGDPAGTSSLAPAKPLCSEPLSPAWAADGDPGNGFDLDTIDSGFADSDCGSPVDCAFEGRCASCSSPRAEGSAASLPSYVKQWVACYTPPQPS
ncbi:interleukin-21 receptor isoform X2 [Eublepharis macularius]|uniref:Interleukin-21 receptor isoform X2 n=1 Tax=Eublepharis macularius TaxID=481883 RepID=A0AA97K0D6_EUBMA|nr:interleukin-21 receptor isoform X2 [Eublepharis macularius]